MIFLRVEFYIAIYYAAMCGHERIVVFLLSRRANVIYGDVISALTSIIQA